MYEQYFFCICPRTLRVSVKRRVNPAGPPSAPAYVASLSFPRRVPWQMSVRDKNRRTAETLPLPLYIRPRSVLGLFALTRAFLHTTHDPLPTSPPFHRFFTLATAAVSGFLARFNPYRTFITNYNHGHHHRYIVTVWTHHGATSTAAKN